MLLSLWYSIPCFFWIAYLCFTKGRPIRHIGFLHYFIYFLVIYSGSFAIYMENGGTNHWFIVSVMAYPLISFLGMLFGTLFGKSVYAVDVSANHRSGSKETIIVIGCTVFFLTVLMMYLIILGKNIPLYVALTSGREGGHVARYIATKGYQEMVGGIGALVWIPRILIDYFGIFLLIFGYYLAKKQLAGYAKLAALIIALSFICLIFNEKYPVLKLIFYFSMGIYSIRHPRITLRTVFPGIALFLLFLFGMGVVYVFVLGEIKILYGKGIIGSIAAIMDWGWTMFLTRVLQGQCTPLYQIFKVIPDAYDYFQGSTLTNPHGIFPYDQIVLPYLIFNSYLTNVPGVQGSDPTIFFGEIYANFGLAISYLSMFTMGFVIQFVNSKISRRIEQTDSFYYVAYFYMTMVYIGDFAVGFSTLYFDERLYFLILLYFLPLINFGFKLVRSKRKSNFAKSIIAITKPGTPISNKR